MDQQLSKLTCYWVGCRLYNQIEFLQVIDWHVQGFIVVVMHKMLLIAGPESGVEFVQIWMKVGENAL